MKKEIPTLPFNSSQGMIMLAASIYSVALSFIVQEYVSSPAVNSLVNNISVAVSVAFALAIGSFVDQHDAWRILFFTTLLSGIACLLPPLIFDLDKVAFIGVLIVVDIVISIISEFDNAARTVYIVRKENREAIPLVQQGISSLNSIASIVGYLLVFVTLSFVALPNYLYLCAALYLLALLIWLRVPADQVVASAQPSFSFSILARDIRESVSIVFKNSIALIFAAEVLFTCRNQLVMSLVILKIGRYDPQFKSILVIGLGIILAVAVGAGLNRAVVSLPAGLKKLSVLTMIVLSAGATYLSGGAGSQLSPFVFGLLLGSIFGTGIPVYTYLETSRIMKTPAAYQGRSTALLRFVGIFLTLIMALVLGFFEGRVKSSVALYFSAGAIILLVIFCLVLLQSAREKNA